MEARKTDKIFKFKQLKYPKPKRHQNQSLIEKIIHPTINILTK